MQKIHAYGIVLGLVMPIIGVFMGLQVSTTLGSLFAFPFIVVSYLTNTPFGNWNIFFWIIAFALSIGLWIAILKILKRIF